MASKGWWLGLVVAASLACGGIEGLVDDAMKQMNPPAAEVPDPPATEAAVEAAAPAPATGGGNVAACTKYVEAVNAAPCMSAAKLDASVICSAGLDQVPCDLAKYYTCMAENTKCNGPIPDLAGTAGCGQPTCQ